MFCQFFLIYKKKILLSVSLPHVIFLVVFSNKKIKIYSTITCINCTIKIISIPVYKIYNIINIIIANSAINKSNILSPKIVSVGSPSVPYFSIFRLYFIATIKTNGTVESKYVFFSPHSVHHNE